MRATSVKQHEDVLKDDLGTSIILSLPIFTLAFQN